MMVALHLWRYEKSFRHGLPGAFNQFYFTDGPSQRDYREQSLSAGILPPPSKTHPQWRPCHRRFAGNIP
jgi:hypothetical protein